MRRRSRLNDYSFSQDDVCMYNKNKRNDYSELHTYSGIRFIEKLWMLSKGTI